MTNSMSLLYIAVIAGIIRTGRVRTSDWFWLVGVALLLGQAKMTCVILYALLLIPCVLEARSHRPAAAVGSLATCLPGLAGALAWTYSIRHIVPLLGTDFTLAEYRASVRLLISHPTGVIGSMLATLVQPLDLFKEQIHNPARRLELATGTEARQLPLWISLAAFLVLVLLLIATAQIWQDGVRPWMRSVAWLVVIAFSAVTVVAMLLMGNTLLRPDKLFRLGKAAYGLQGRYFVPILPLLPLLLPDFHIHTEARGRRTLALTSIVLAVSAFAATVCSHLIVF